jgi:hypothetical protein
MAPHDAYLSHFMETIGRDETVISLQRQSAKAFQDIEIMRQYPAGRVVNAGLLMTIADTYRFHAYASRQARILMGIEE